MSDYKWNPDLGEHGDQDGHQLDYTLDDPTLYPKQENSPEGVQSFHQRSDVDSSQQSQHHTLGLRRNQGSPGNHTHDGSNSLVIPQGNEVAEWLPFSTFWASDGTQPDIGNGVIYGKYCKIGKVCIFKWKLIFGTTTTFGSGSFLIQLPFAPQLNVSPLVQFSDLAGVVSGTEPGVAFYTGATAWSNIGSYIYIFSHGSGTGWGGTNPTTWASGGRMNGQITYETVN